MSTYLELKAKAEELLAQAEIQRQKEVAEVIAEIHLKMAEYNISIKDLSVKPKKPAVIQYRSPSGETWSGRGRKPLWIMKAIEAGKSIEDFKV